MADLNSKSIYRGFLMRAVLWGAFAAGIAASPLLAQDVVGGNFTLAENARFGNTVLEAGRYKFSVEAVGSLQSMRSIEEGAGHLVLVVVRPEKAGPIATMFAMASPNTRSHEASELVLEPQKAEALATTLYLEKEGIVVDLNWSSPKGKSPVVAQQTVPVQPAAASKAGGDS